MIQILRLSIAVVFCCGSIFATDHDPVTKETIISECRLTYDAAYFLMEVDPQNNPKLFHGIFRDQTMLLPKTFLRILHSGFFSAFFNDDYPVQKKMINNMISGVLTLLSFAPDPTLNESSKEIVEDEIFKVLAPARVIETTIAIADFNHNLIKIDSEEERNAYIGKYMEDNDMLHSSVAGMQFPTVFEMMLMQLLQIRFVLRYFPEISEIQRDNLKQLHDAIWNRLQRTETERLFKDEEKPHPHMTRLLEEERRSTSDSTTGGGSGGSL